MSIATSLLSQIKIESFLGLYRRWKNYDNIVCKNKDQSPLSNPKANINGKQILLCVWWDCRGIIHHKFEVKFNDYYRYIHSIVAKNERKIL